MSNRRRISRNTFQTVFAVGTVVTILVAGVIYIGIFFNPNIFGALVPLLVVGLFFGTIYVGGKIYDRWYNKSSTD